MQKEIAGLGRRTHVTEFGADLSGGHSFEQYVATGVGSIAGNVNCLRGLHDAVVALREAGDPVAGAFHWHGWHNGDEYDLWSPTNALGAASTAKIISVESG